MPNLKDEINGYTLDQILGSGGFGTVYQVTKTADNTRYAMKIVLINLTQKDIDESLKEGNITAQLSSPHIVKLEEMFPECDKVCMVLELCTGGDLQKLVENHPSQLTRENILKWTRQIALALEYLHGRRVVHRDLKPANILLDDKNCCKVSDFGLVRILKTNVTVRTQNLAGTYNYMAPEHFDRVVTTKMDIWSFGCIIYFLCMKQEPFRARSDLELREKIMKGEFQPITTNGLDDFQNLVECLLKKDRNQRPTVKQLLKDPLFNATVEIQLPVEVTLTFDVYKLPCTWKELDASTHYLPFLFRVPSPSDALIIGSVCKYKAENSLVIGASLHPTTPATSRRLNLHLKINVDLKKKYVDEWYSYGKEFKTAAIAHHTPMCFDAKQLSELFTISNVNWSQFCAKIDVRFQLVKD